jgi:NAD(P)-dependent dehydrogenase (short-subunit alcohol dehydrogenase family)
VHDPVFLVTGASGGLGLELVSRLSAQGRRVVATDLDNHRLEEAARRAAWPMSQVRLCALDVRQASHWAAGFALGARAFGGVDVLLDAEGQGTGALEAAATLMLPRGPGHAVLLALRPAAAAARAAALAADRELRPCGLAVTVVYCDLADRAAAEELGGWLAEAVLSGALPRRPRELVVSSPRCLLGAVATLSPALATLLFRLRERWTRPAAAAARTHA